MIKNLFILGFVVHCGISLRADHAVKSFAIDHMPVLTKDSCQHYQVKQAQVNRFFFPTSLALSQSTSVVTDPRSLSAVAQDTLRYLEHARLEALPLVSPPAFDRDILSIDRVRKTLQFVVDTVQQDEITGSYRITDPDFITQHFSAIKWHGDVSGAHERGKQQVKDGKILLTHYMAFCCNGNYQKSTTTPYALYQVASGIAPQFTKQEVLRGVLHTQKYSKKIKPLVWLSRHDLETVMLQGVGFITMPDGKVRLVNVHLHNNIAYDHTIKNSHHQRRYWYFKETIGDKVTIQRKLYEQRKDVIFAGDVYNIGIGKLVLLTYQNLITRKPACRLGIIADTGAAFYNNLYQLDAFVGMVSSHQQLRQQISYMLDTVNAYIIYKKEEHA